MGIESYFLNAKMQNAKMHSADPDNLQEIYMVLETSGMFVKRRNNQLLIEEILQLRQDMESDICISACFCCFEKSLQILMKVINELKRTGMIEYFYYGNIIIDKDSSSNIKNIIINYTKEKRNYFYNIFGNESIELLPEQFYKYHNGSRVYKYLVRYRIKHRKRKLLD